MITEINGTEYSVQLSDAGAIYVSFGNDHEQTITFNATTAEFVCDMYNLEDTEAVELIRRITEAQQAAKMLAGL